MVELFELALKSTLDKACTDLAAEIDLDQFVDMDDLVNTQEVYANEYSALLWQFMSLDEAPMEPLFNLYFMVGVKTALDPANYQMMSFLSSVKRVFRKGGSLDIMDYSGELEPTEVLGNIYFTDTGLDNQVVDKDRGIRMVTVEARVMKFMGA